MKLIKILRKIKRRFSRYNPSVEIFISHTDILFNLNEFRRQYPNCAFAPVLKSNAYGHGLVPVAQILDRENIAFFVVDSLFEAMILRAEDIKSKILIIGYTPTQNIANSKIDVSFTITSLEQLKDVAQNVAKKKKIHLKIDTGMHRQGILPSEIDEALEIIRLKNKSLELEGVCSHFADADSADENFTMKQIKCWNETVKKLTNAAPNIKFFHLSATAGSYYHEKIKENVIRLGIGLYGIGVGKERGLSLRPALQMETVISSVKTISPNEYVGYGITYKTAKQTKIATVPLGYFEGLDRRLSNIGYLKIGDHFCPIAGRVSMNIASLDVSEIPNIKIGDKVIVISREKTDRNSVENLAKIIGTIPYEILVHLPQHLRRTVISIEPH